MSTDRTIQVILAAVTAVFAMLHGALPSHAADGDPGTPDTAFNANVGATLDNSVWAAAEQSDGKLVVGGFFTGGLKRFNADGTEQATLPASATLAVAVQPDDKIVAGGTFAGKLKRFNADGTEDADFNSNVGASLDNTVFALAVQPDGKIVVGGGFTGKLKRFNADGTEDTAFNTNIGSILNNTVWSLRVQPDGTILAGGAFTGRLKRFNAVGTTDTAFNTNIGSTLNNTVRAIGVQSDGRIVVGGQFTGYLKAYGSDGTADSAFTTRLGSVSSNVYAVSVQDDDTFLVGGAFTEYLKQYAADGTEDSAFTTNVAASLDSAVYATTVQSSGKILVGGNFTGYLKRFNGDPVGTAPSVGAVSISGVARPGRTVSVSAPEVTGDPAPSLSYQWQSKSGGVWSDVEGATSSSLTIPGALGGVKLRVQVTATNSAGSDSATSRVRKVGQSVAVTKSTKPAGARCTQRGTVGNDSLGVSAAANKTTVVCVYRGADTVTINSIGNNARVVLVKGPGSLEVVWNAGGRKHGDTVGEGALTIVRPAAATITASQGGSPNVDLDGATAVCLTNGAYAQAASLTALEAAITGTIDWFNDETSEWVENSC